MRNEIDEETSPEDWRFSGGARWIFTVAAVGAVFVAAGLMHRSPPFAILVAITGVINGVGAVINWRNWLKKSEAEKASFRFLPQLQMKEVRIPFKRDEFNQARATAHLNLSIAAIAFFFVIGGVLPLFNPHLPLSRRLDLFPVGIVAAWILWHCGRRALRGMKMLTCPGCKDMLTSQAKSVLETRCCRKCGYTVLVD